MTETESMVERVEKAKREPNWAGPIVFQCSACGASHTIEAWPTVVRCCRSFSVESPYSISIPAEE